MCPFNATTGSRPVAPVLSTSGDDSGVDARQGRVVLAWNTSPLFPSFPTRPFATGTIPYVDAGQAVPLGSRIVFDLDPGDPPP